MINNPENLQLFLKRFIQLLEDDVDKKIGGGGFSIINHYYGLDGKESISEEEISNRMKVSIEKIKETCLNIIENYQTLEGKIKLKNLILMAYS